MVDVRTGETWITVTAATRLYHLDHQGFLKWIAREFDFWAATDYESLANKKMHIRSWFQCFMFRQVKDLCCTWINYHLLFNRKMFNKLDRLSFSLSFFQSPSPEGAAVQEGSIQLYDKHTLFVPWIPALSPAQLSTILQKTGQARRMEILKKLLTRHMHEENPNFEPVVQYMQSQSFPKFWINPMLSTFHMKSTAVFGDWSPLSSTGWNSTHLVCIT